LRRDLYIDFPRISYELDRMTCTVTQPCARLRSGVRSRFTVEGAFDCAERWRSFPCTEVARNTTPDCDVPGERAAGAMCLFHTRCSSRDCLGAGVTPSCKTCIEEVAAAGACDDLTETCAQGTRTQCVKGTRCENGTCVAVDSQGLSEAADQACQAM
jgi:hypothetical protein